MLAETHAGKPTLYFLWSPLLNCALQVEVEVLDRCLPFCTKGQQKVDAAYQLQLCDMKPPTTLTCAGALLNVSYTFRGPKAGRKQALTHLYSPLDLLRQVLADQVPYLACVCAKSYHDPAPAHEHDARSASDAAPACCSAWNSNQIAPVW